MSHHCAACSRRAKSLPVHTRTFPFGTTDFKLKRARENTTANNEFLDETTDSQSFLAGQILMPDNSSRTAKNIAAENIFHEAETDSQ